MADEKKVNAVEEPVKKKNQFIEVIKRMTDNKGAVVGGILFIIVLVIAIIAPLIAPYDYSEMNILERLQAPSLAHIFGTDHMGRDVFSRIVYGARYSLIIGIGSVIFSAVFGVILGAISGYFGG